MDELRTTYRKIVTSTAVFGGAQLLNVVVNTIRGRLVATILHSTGMGVMSLLSNAANIVQQIALMGINISAVRNVSQVREQGDERVLDFTVRLVRVMVFASAILGLVLTVLLSPLMSEFSFGNNEYVSFFLLLSVSVFFSIMGTGEMTIMQGLRRYKQLAFCSTIPPACGLLLSIPLYYIWGIKGIVPAMILANVVYFCVIRSYSYRRRQTEGARERLTLRRVWVLGHDIIQFGFVMTVGVVIGTITTYALSAFISNHGSVSDVGFYQAANVVTMQYVGIIFTAMATDYYPHLSAMVKTSMKDAFRLVNQQTEIVLLVITPLSMLIILTTPLLISVLLGSDFLVIRSLVRFLGLAAIFKALCFPMDYIAYAKGDKHYLFWVETAWGNLKTFSIMAGFYAYMGLEGLGYGALCTALIDVAVSISMTRWRYGFRLSGISLKLLTILVLSALLCFGCSYVSPAWWSYGLMTIITFSCSVFCIIQLDRRLDLRSLIARWKNEKSKKNS